MEFGAAEGAGDGLGGPALLGAGEVAVALHVFGDALVAERGVAFDAVHWV